MSVVPVNESSPCATLLLSTASCSLQYVGQKRVVGQLNLRRGLVITVTTRRTTWLQRSIWREGLQKEGRGEGAHSFSAFLRAFSSFGIKPPTSSDQGFLIWMPHTQAHACGWCSKRPCCG